MVTPIIGKCVPVSMEFGETEVGDGAAEIHSPVYLISRDFGDNQIKQ
jgi:hypothetical protein